MAAGAGLVAAQRAGITQPIDPRLHAVGTIAAAYRAYPHIGPVLPALGYSTQQREDLLATIDHCNADVIVDASPAGIEHLYNGAVPVWRVAYPFAQRRGPDFAQAIDAFLARNGVRPHEQ
jgi:predicted GTPase